jgi:predicted metal-binding membrane protein
MWRAQSDSRLLGLTLACLCLLAWAALLLGNTTPIGARLDHSQLHGLSMGPTTEFLAASAVFVAGWFLMTVAMMLPTSVPLVLLFGKITSQRSNSGALIGLLLLGYLGAWTAFGAGAYALDLGIHHLVESSVWLHANVWPLLALPLLVAGVYQFTPLKYACLDKCRSPYSFVVGHWRGRSPLREALQLGVHHGVYCIGCCWSLMLLMFAISVGSLVWMFALAILMGIEKNLPWGRRLSQPVGVVLLAAGITIVGMNIGTI